MKNGANTSLKNNNGQTALDKANEYKLTDVANLLGKYGLSQLKARKVVESGLDGAYAPHITKEVQKYLGAGKGRTLKRRNKRSKKTKRHRMRR